MSGSSDAGGATAATEQGSERTPVRLLGGKGRPGIPPLVLVGFLSILLLVVVLLLVTRGGDRGGLGSGGGESLALGPAGEKLYPDRPDALPQDQERPLGETVSIGQVEVRATTSAYAPDFQNDSNYVLVRVALTNTGQEARAVGPSNFRLVAPDGTELAADADVTAQEVLQRTTLEAGDTASGRVYFDVGDRTGAHWMIWNFDAADAPVGAWQVPVEP